MPPKRDFWYCIFIKRYTSNIHALLLKITQRKNAIYSANNTKEILNHIIDIYVYIDIVFSKSHSLPMYLKILNVSSICICSDLKDLNIEIPCEYAKVIKFESTKV